MKLLRLRCLVLTMAVALAAPASATWSILIVNRKTGEVGIGQATCVAGSDLMANLACVRAGVGVGAVQGGWDPDGKRRKRMWNNLGSQTPQWILDNKLLPIGQTHSMQYGLISVNHGAPASYSGFALQNVTCGTTGEFGDYAYAVQGNVLAGEAVCTMAAQALIDTDGDLITKLMAGMETAGFYGGDGRCSCSVGGPATCGSPPPSFTKTAHTGYIIVSRRGDPEGECASTGCATGDYYYSFNLVGSATSADPVTEALLDYGLWRAGMLGVPDQARSLQHSSAQELVADGLSQAQVEVRLRDLNGTPITSGGATLTVTPRFEGLAPGAPGPVTDHGDGRYSFAVTASQDAGRATYEVRVNDGSREVLLWPPVSIETRPLADLVASHYELSSAQGGSVSLFLNRGAVEAGRGYRVLGSASGTSPGTTLGGLAIPLNPDRLYALTLGATAPRVFENFVGVLDSDGRAQPRFHLEPSQASSLIGASFSFSAMLGDLGSGPELTQLDSFLLLP